MISPAEITYLSLRNLFSIYLYVKPSPQQLKVAALSLGNSSPATRAARVPGCWGSSQPKQHRGAQEKSLGCFFFPDLSLDTNSIVLKEDARYLAAIKRAHGWFSKTFQPSLHELTLGRGEARCGAMGRLPGSCQLWDGLDIPRD